MLMLPLHLMLYLHLINDGGALDSIIEPKQSHTYMLRPFRVFERPPHLILRTHLLRHEIHGTHIGVQHSICMACTVIILKYFHTAHTIVTKDTYIL
jgi:hypothetical protein